MPAYSAEFIDQFGRFPNRTLAEWRAGGWRNLIDRLLAASGLNEIEFERFLHALRILHGAAADFVQLHKLSAEQSRLAYFGERDRPFRSIVTGTLKCEFGVISAT
ncbi:hypothetical protein [Variovorax paradoxus]|uniref:hypothetical protein n=1 Tax=Variovorax paradoxus TaxID=34073 RepID=UPI003ECD0E09